MVLKNPDRRKFPVINAISSVAFIMALVGLTFWVSTLSSRLNTVVVMQTNVLKSNVEFGQQCEGIKNELSRINKHLNRISLMPIAPTTLLIE